MASININGVVDDIAVKDYSTLDIETQQLINAAMEARKYAYCPYSKFDVGAAVRTSNGKIYTGCNIENSTYPAGVCAERTAVAKAVSEGEQTIVALAVVAQQKDAFTTPCGLCRQFLAEFAKDGDMPIYCAKPVNPPLRVLCTTLAELLPRTFSLSSSAANVS